MAITSTHPEYSNNAPDWQIVEDCRKGERHIKNKGQVYLPATSGMWLDGMKSDKDLGMKRYNAYKLRAKFPDLVKKTVQDLLGMMHRKPAAFELPKKMEGLIDRATDEGESLQLLLQRINEAQLYKGRVGLLVDVPVGDINVLPYISTFKAERIINWDESQRDDGRDRLDFVVIDETEPVRDGFEWRDEQRYRLLDLDPEGKYRVRVIKLSSSDVDSSGIGASASAAKPGELTAEGDETAIIPSIGGRELVELPFIFVGSTDNTPEVDEIPMLALANLALCIYRGEADYRQALFLQGQDTLVIIGNRIGTDPENEDAETMVGAGSVINVDAGGDAKYIGVESSGISEQRQAIQNDKNDSRELGASLISAGDGGGKEAEGTIRIRVGTRTASLQTIARAGAEGLEKALKEMATWMGLNPDEVQVTPNLDFVQDQVTPKDLVDLTTAKKQGFPLADVSLHNFAKDHDMTKLEFEDELKEIEKDLEREEERNPLFQMPPVMVGPDGQPLQPPPPENEEEEEEEDAV